MSSTNCNTGCTGSECQSRGSSQHPPGSVLTGSHFVAVVGSSPEVSLKPLAETALPNSTPCWICLTTDAHDATICLRCDSNANRAHVTCIINRAFAKNKEDYCNICAEDSIGEEDNKSLQKQYNSNM